MGLVPGVADDLGAVHPGSVVEGVAEEVEDVGPHRDRVRGLGHEAVVVGVGEVVQRRIVGACGEREPGQQVCDEQMAEAVETECAAP